MSDPRLDHIKLFTKQVTVIDHEATGMFARFARENIYKLSLREVARRLKVSAVYLSHLERGKRPWNTERLEKFKKALTSSAP